MCVYPFGAVFQFFILCITEDRGRGIVLAVFRHRSRVQAVSSPFRRLIARSPIVELCLVCSSSLTTVDDDPDGDTSE